MRHRLNRGTHPAAALALVAFAVTGFEADAQPARPERIGQHPNLNGIWQAATTAYWNLEAHSAEALDGFWQLGALGAIPAGQSVVVGGKIPYKPEKLAQREENRANWPASDPAAACYMPGIPRATYQPFPFQIIQGDGDMLFVYSFAKANRPVHMSDHMDMAPVDQWMGWSNGRWEGDTLVVTVNSNDERTWLDRAGNYHSNQMVVTERYTLLGENHMQYEATIDDPETFTRPWTIRVPLYRHMEPNAELLEYNCVEFAEPLLYGEFLKEPIQ
ncbi:MAG: hypothetical protein JXB36_06575 [Gammaproteobacteria bacterium]|nr:hypothetical protein [Gammaproteobacteria bacterium]